MEELDRCTALLLVQQKLLLEIQAKLAKTETKLARTTKLLDRTEDFGCSNIDQWCHHCLCPVDPWHRSKCTVCDFFYCPDCAKGLPKSSCCSCVTPCTTCHSTHKTKDSCDPETCSYLRSKN